MELIKEKVKTPASILHEEMTKKKLVPTYELILDGTGNPHPLFTYKLTCDKESVVGSGRCKKIAKQEAANEMLKKLKLVNCISETSSDSHSTIPESSDEELLQPLLDNESDQKNLHSEDSNAVQILMKLCVDNLLPAPNFVTSIMGPSHTPNFTTQCTVSHYEEVGYAPSKKTAKRYAALKMINAIKNGKSIPINAECQTMSELGTYVSPRINYLLSLKKTDISMSKDENHVEKFVPCEESTSIKTNISPEIQSQLSVVKESIEKLLQLI
ncbi:RISC-loading complex subunit TARBP2-like [Leptopilina boulardi]|uniref:RISC-loading complex subunit TARBP2-like n=1 Tax=Leptopilina boulardi TaxID=63433 RepID=UPI0021F568E6|nr:RISC-loading complex subunit TARBP2-like [Leptopilina boulardi]